MSTPSDVSERFGDFDFERATGALRKWEGGRVVEETRLRPKPAALLALLLDHRGQLTPRDLIRERLWPDVVVDFDANLHHCVRQLRSALGESAKNARHLQTVPRRGYRLVVGEADADDVQEDQRNVVAPRRRWLGWGIAAGIVGAAAAMGLWHAQSGVVRLAILPFDTPTMEQADARDAARLAEHLLAELTQALGPRGDVIGPRSTRPMRDEGQDVRSLARGLDASYLLNLRTIETATRPEFLLELIRVEDGRHVWVERYDRLPEDSARISTEVAAELIG